MTKISTLIVFLFMGASLWSQTRIEENNGNIRAILTNWDPIRGEWLSSSLTSVSNNSPVPVRTFPERLTIAQLFTFVPTVKRDSVQTLLRENDSIRRSDGTAYVNIALDISRFILFASRRGTTLRSFTFGDPHIVDFDNNSTTLTSCGEFVLAKSKNSTFEVQARFEKINELASFSTATSMNVGGDLVSLYASDKPDNFGHTMLRVNGTPAICSDGVHYLPMGGVILYQNNQYRINWPNGESAIIDIKSHEDKYYLNIALEIFDEDKKNYEGLSVNSNVSKISENRVSKSSSLFNYSDSKNYEFYNQSQHISPAKRSIPETERKLAEEQCKNAGVSGAEMEGCIYDYAHYRIIPSPRPQFSNPSDEINLKDLSEVDDNSNDNQQVEPVTAQRKPSGQIIKNPEVARQFTNVLLRILIEASSRSNPGAVIIGR